MNNASPQPLRFPGAGRGSAMPWRRVALVAHRYVGLAMTVFLVVAGLTGTVIAFYHELDAALNPGLYRALPPSPDAPRLNVEALRKAAEGQLPEGLRVSYLGLDAKPDEAVVLYAAPEDPRLADADNQYFLDPYTGRLLGSRKWGDLGQGMRNLLPFVYRLHYSLALGTVGTYLFGFVAVLWTFDCFVGAYLTFPSQGRSGQTSAARAWIVRWKPAWLLRANKLFSFVFTWHRASGLWVWAMLLVFAWSAVGLNLQQVYRPVMSAAFGMDEDVRETLPKLIPPRHEPKLSFGRAHHFAQSLMARQAALRAFEVDEERALGYDEDTGAYWYEVRSSLDISDRYPATTLWLDGDDGEYLGFEAPTGGRAGNTITTWLYHLHWGSIAMGGLAYRVFVSLMGLVVTGLSVTGAWIWWRKRNKAAAKHRRKAAMAACQGLPRCNGNL